MKRYFLIYILLFLIFSSTTCLATHIVGGEMNYHYLGNKQYEMTLTVYRDCFNGIPPFDNPAAIGVYDERGNLVLSTSVNIDIHHGVPNAINSPCLTPPSNVCYEVAQYMFNITLPTDTESYTVSYQRCCRNSSILNLTNVQGTGATYFAVIPNPRDVPVNSNPVFNNWPPTFICKDAPFTFDHSATDPDGDSLVYELSTPFNGGDMMNPIPAPPDPPPYAPVIFRNPYSVSNPLGGTPMKIDSRTGALTATPNSNGQFVYGVTVQEYRNGELIGETVRDFQVNVVPCPQLTVASIYSPIVTCGSYDAAFANYSYNAATYQWFFGDTTTLTDTSSQRNPVYTYPAFGIYNAILVAYSGFNPLCNDTAHAVVHINPSFHSNFGIENDHCSNEFSFSDSSHGQSGAANFWSWSFGDFTFSSDPNPVHVYPTPGEYEVRLSASADFGCQDTMFKTIHVLDIPVSNFSLFFDTCSQTVISNDSTLHAATFFWKFSDNYETFTRDVVHRFAGPGEYDIQLFVASDSFCLDTSQMHVSVPPLPTVGLGYNVPPCDSNVQFTNFSTNATYYTWNFGDNVISHDFSPLHTYSLSGRIPVRLIATSQHGCQAILDTNIFFISKKYANFDSWVDSCKGIVNFINLSKNSVYYYWQFGDGSISEEENPIHKYIKDGGHDVSLTVNRNSFCPDSISKPVYYESPLGEKLFIPNSFTPNADGHNDLFSLSLYRPCELYSISIFNRWGQKVFESDDAANIEWDGTFNGEKLAEDVYVYIIENTDNRRVGTLTIIR